MEQELPPYINNPPNVFVLTQAEISNIYQNIFIDLQSEEETYLTKNYLNNLIQEKLDNCLLCRRLKLNLTRISTEIADNINLVRPIFIPNNLNLLPLHIEYQVNQFKRVISRKYQWHQIL